MQTQNLLSSLKLLIDSKDNVMHKKASIIISTLVSGASNLPQLNLDNDRTVSIYLLGSCFKLLDKAVCDDHYENSQPLLFLINFLLPRCNASVIVNNQLVVRLQNVAVQVLNNKNHSLIATKYSIAVLAEIVLLHHQITNQVNQIIDLFMNNALMHPGALERKQTTKYLELIMDKHHQIHREVSHKAKTIILEAVQTGKRLYLNGIIEIAKHFPTEILNDIAYASKLQLRIENDLEEEFLLQIYFFLDKLMEKTLITANISEQILKELINNIPNAVDNEKLLFGYMQAVYESLSHLNNANRKVAKRYLSSVISIFSEMLLLKGKVVRQAESLLKDLLANTVDNSLWNKTQVDILDFEGLELDDSHAFTKSTAMLKDLLSSRYEVVKHSVLNILEVFFCNLDESAFQLTKPLVTQFQNMRQNYPAKEYNQVFGKIINAFGYGNILAMYPISLQGDPTAEQFDESNNLWLLKIIAKNAKQDNVQIFIQYFLPLIKATEMSLHAESKPLRKNIYVNILTRLWETFQVLHLVTKKNHNFQFLLAEIQRNLVEELAYFEPVIRGLDKFATSMLHKVKYVSERAEKIIPTLAKILKIEHPISTSILAGISALSKICSKEYINRVFEKNILKLIQECESKKLSDNFDTNIKNLQILMAISHGINFFDSSVMANRLSKEETVVKLIQYLITSDNGFQKKAYKYLLQCLGYMPEGFSKQALQMLDKFEQTLPFSKGYRISILLWVWNRAKYTSEQSNLEQVLQFVKKYLPQLIIALRESNKRVRRASRQLFDLVLQKMKSLNLLQNFVEIICAGFASNTTSVKADTINALVITLDKFQAPNSDEFLSQLTDLTLILLREKKKEIYKAVLVYLKKYLQKVDKLKQAIILPAILKDLFETDEDSKMEYRSLLKHFLLKLIKRHTQDTFTSMVPEQHQRFIRSIVKAENLLKRKKRQKKLEFLAQQNLYKSNKKNKKNEESSGQQSQSEQQQLQTNNFRQNNAMEEEKPIESGNKNNLLLKYDLDKEDFHFVGQKTVRPQPKQSVNKEDDQQVKFVDGRIVFKEVKRKREDAGSDEDQKQIQQRQLPRKIKNIKVDTIHQVKESGVVYRSNRAGGDIRLKDKPQPHAFIQLSSKALNKRYKHKAEKTFEQIFEKKEGGLKGLKSKVLSKLK